MTKQARGFLYYLRRYLETHPDRRPALLALHKKLTGAALDKSTLWRHINFRSEPVLSHSMIYLAFLHREKAILPGKIGNGLFTYAFPELLKPAKK